MFNCNTLLHLTNCVKALVRGHLSEIVDAVVTCCQGYDIPLGAKEIIARPLYNWLLSIKIRRLYAKVRIY